jgi:hypothetical protein
MALSTRWSSGVVEHELDDAEMAASIWLMMEGFQGQTRSGEGEYAPEFSYRPDFEKNSRKISRKAPLLAKPREPDDDAGWSRPL